MLNHKATILVVTHWQCGRLLHLSNTGGGNLTHLLCVSLVSLLEETVSKTCLFRIGQYHLALLNSPQKEAYEYMFKGPLV